MRISHLFKTLEFWRAHRAVNREPVWENILPLFFFHRDGVLAIQRLAREWTRLYGLRRVDVFRGTVVNEKWSNRRIAGLLDQNAENQRCPFGTKTFANSGDAPPCRGKSGRGSHARYGIPD